MPKKDISVLQYKPSVAEDVQNGRTLEELIKKYPHVSLYYLKKWSGEAFKSMDLDTLVRMRFRHQVKSSVDIAQSKMESLPYDEILDISDETWDEWCEILRGVMYDLTKEVIKRR